MGYVKKWVATIRHIKKAPRLLTKGLLKGYDVL
jgi:hypothetical protein